MMIKTLEIVWTNNMMINEEKAGEMSEKKIVQGENVMRKEEEEVGVPMMIVVCLHVSIIGIVVVDGMMVEEEKVGGRAVVVIGIVQMIGTEKGVAGKEIVTEIKNIMNERKTVIALESLMIPLLMEQANPNQTRKGERGM